MSRSYKHTPVYTSGNDKCAKRQANKKVRRKGKFRPEEMKNGKSNHYRKEYESWDICDYRFWGEPIWREESLRNLRDDLERWQKFYRRK